MPESLRLRRAWLRRAWTRLALVLLAVCPLLVLVAARIVYGLAYRDSDFFTFWLAGYMNWTGQNPYSSAEWLGQHHALGATWFPNPVFPYPLPLATLLAPLGLLRLDTAYIVWISLSFLLLVVALFVILLRRPAPRLKHYLFPILAGLLLFRPMWVTLHDGQLGAVLLFALVISAALLEDRRWFLGGLAAALVAVKPTLGVPILGLLGLWLLATRQWRALAGLGAGLAVLLALGLARDPNWVGEFLTVGQWKLSTGFGFSPSLWGMAGAVCGHAPGCTTWLGGALAGALTVGLAAVLLLFSARYSALQVVALSIVASLLVTPYLWAYDQILLLLPITLVIGALIERSPVFLLNALAFLALDVLALGLLFLALQTGEDVWSGLLPLLVGAALLWPLNKSEIGTLPAGARPQPLASTAAPDHV
jgi:Glycosyltransferase family 87